MKTFFRIILAAVVMIGSAGFGAAEPVDGLVAVVSDSPITQLGVERFTDREVEYIRRQYATQPETQRRQILAVYEDGLRTLIEHQIILQEFKENVKVPESYIDDIVQDRIKERSHGDNVELTKELELEGITREQFKQRIRDQIIIEMMRQQFLHEPIISPRKIEEYYTAHHSEFKLEDQIKMRIIVLNNNSADSADRVRMRAGEILSQIKGGASFEDLARTYSDGSQKADGGETGWEDVSVVNKFLAAEVAKLKPGEYSGVIEAPDGYYLILLEDRHAAHIKPLSEVRDQIERVLAGREMERLARQWIERLQKKTFVQHF